MNAISRDPILALRKSKSFCVNYFVSRSSVSPITRPMCFLKSIQVMMTFESGSFELVLRVNRLK